MVLTSRTILMRTHTIFQQLKWPNKTALSRVGTARRDGAVDLLNDVIAGHGTDVVEIHRTDFWRSEIDQAT